MKVLIARMLYGGWERGEVGDFISEISQHFRPPVEEVIHCRVDWQPVDCSRNRAVVTARNVGADVMMMIDADMVPAAGFWGQAIGVLTQWPTAMIGSPYSGQRQHGSAAHGSRVHVLHRKDHGRYLRIGPGAAAKREGVEEVHGVGTGLCAIGMKAFDLVRPPWFDFKYTSPEHVSIAQSEDFGFCLKLRDAGGKIFVDWDHWSGHSKESTLEKPGPDELEQDEED